MIINQVKTHNRIRIRISVLSFFLAQGLCFASWASRLPDIKDKFSADNYLFFAFLMFLIPIGKFLAIPTVGILLPKIGSKKTVLISITGFICSLLIVGIVNNIYLIGLIMLLFGTFWNMTDLSLNTQAIEVERIYGKSIMASFHASWSFAACIGALIGYLMINLGIASSIHFLGMAIFSIILVLINYPYLREETQISQRLEQKEIKEKTKNRFRNIETLLISLGIIWLLALIVENTMFEWSDVYFQSVIKAPSSLQIGFLVFMLMMFIGRLLTSTAYRFWKKKTILQIAGVAIFIGFTISSQLVDFVSSVQLKATVIAIGFMLIGLGISCIVPTIYSIVGDKAKTSVGTALTIMASISFVGPLAAPAIVGFASEHVNMEFAYLLIGLFGACIVLIATFDKNLRD